MRHHLQQPIGRFIATFARRRIFAEKFEIGTKAYADSNTNDLRVIYYKKTLNQNKMAEY